MPKQLFEINTFSAGIISDPIDELDIPNSAASIALNIDPLNEGELKGIPEVQVLKDTGFQNNFTAIVYTRPSAYSTAEQINTQFQHSQNTE
tara:strand:- start:8194 stop:8466 length:273 start_codon:yes stop_codon:yes gene_type:complete